MLARHLHLLSAFAGGCVTTVVLVVVMHENDGARVAPQHHAPPARPSDDAVAPADVASSGPDVAPTPEPAPAKVAGQRSAPPAPRDDGEATAEPGDSVADVLARLEASYRERLSATEPPSTGASDGAASGALTSEPPAPARAAVALAASTPAPPVAPASTAAAPPTTTALPEPISVLAAAADARQRDERARELERELHLASLYRAEAYQQQQLVVLQYLELLSQSHVNNPGSAPRAPRNVTARRSPSFSFPLTNPNNPWGFDLPPTVLVK